ncbi:MAG TPA: c-type cytochrome [Vicinamibacterales bacterium]|nr:c-type cytochrome [Vicinamibacterales bacterium]
MRLLQNALIVAACSGLIPITLNGRVSQKPTSPVAADEQSIADGKQVYDRRCASCHGDRGKGDGMMGEELNPRPADLTEGNWKHGRTDSDIFMVIRNGVKNTGMRAYARRLTTRQMWDVVNYVRTLGPHTH